MGRQIIKQPNGNFALWSYVFDNFIVLDYSEKRLLDLIGNEAKEKAQEHTKVILQKLENNEKPYYQFTMNWNEALDTIKDCHGKDDETLKMINEFLK